MYGQLIELSCLSDEFWRSSLLQDAIRTLQNLPLVSETYETSIRHLICFGAGSLDAESVLGSCLIDVPPQCRVLEQCLVFWRQLASEWQKRPFHASLVVILGKRDVDLARVVLSLIVKGSIECTARKSAVFCAVIQASGVSSDKGPLLNCVHQFVDEFKAKAFSAVFLDPVIVYFALTRNFVMEGDVDVHGSNTFLALLEAATGVKMSRIALLDDEVKVKLYC